MTCISVKLVNITVTISVNCFKKICIRNAMYNRIFFSQRAKGKIRVTDEVWFHSFAITCCWPNTFSDHPSTMCAFGIPVVSQQLWIYFCRFHFFLNCLCACFIAVHRKRILNNNLFYISYKLEENKELEMFNYHI